MCIRDRLVDIVVLAGLKQLDVGVAIFNRKKNHFGQHHRACLLYTSDAADERSSVDLGGRRIIKKQKYSEHA